MSASRGINPPFVSIVPFPIDYIMQNLNNNNLTLALFLSSDRTPGHLGVLVSTLDDIDTRVHLAPGLAYGPALLLAALVLKFITRLRRARLQSGRFPRTTVPLVGPVLCRWISLIPARIVHSVRAVLHGFNAAWIVSVCKATLDDIYGPPSKTCMTLQLTALLVSGLLLVLLVHAVLRFPAWQCWATSGTSVFTRSTDITVVCVDVSLYTASSNSCSLNRKQRN